MKSLPLALICFGFLFSNCSKEVTRTAITGFTVLEEGSLSDQFRSYTATGDSFFGLKDKAIIMEDYHWIDIESNMIGFLKESFPVVEIKEEDYIIYIADHAEWDENIEWASWTEAWAENAFEEMARPLFIKLPSGNLYEALSTLENLGSTVKGHYLPKINRIDSRIAFVRDTNSLQKILAHNQQ